VIYLYNILTWLYYFSIRWIALSGNHRAQNYIESSTKYSYTHLKLLKKSSKRAWLHAASAGELLQLLPLTGKLEADGLELILSVYSPSALSLAESTGYTYFLLPIDTKINAIGLIQKIQPDIFLTACKEFWPNISNQLKTNNIPYILINAHIVTPTPLLKICWWKLYAPYISLACCTDQFSSDFLLNRGVANVLTTGNTKAESVFINALHPHLEIQNYIKGKKVLILGSSHNKELLYMAKFLKENLVNYNDWIWLIVPHHPNIEDRLYFEKKSGINACDFEEPLQDRSPVIFINRTGILAPLYALSEIAFIGGGWINGLHNVLEPARYHNTIIFGPDYNKFPEAAGLIHANAAISVSDYKTFRITLKHLLDSNSLREILASNATAYLTSQAGATEKCYSEIKVLLD